MKNIAIVPNTIKDIGLLHTKRVVDHLFGRANLIMESAFSVTGMNVQYMSREDMYNATDAMIILGGDGTILQEATDCAIRSIPVLGINLGKIGFLTEIEEENLEEALDKLLTEDYRIEERMLLNFEIHKDGTCIYTNHALNDVVVSKSAGARLIEMELYADTELMYRYIADGLIIATPTGSTGYSISAGGPVVDPNMELYVATPICAHMLSVRSAVLSADKPIVIRLDSTYPDNEAVINADGNVHGYISGADEVHIFKSQYRFKLIKTEDKSFYTTLISKL